MLVLSSVRLRRDRCALDRWIPVLATGGYWLASLVLPLVSRIQLLPGSTSGSVSAPDSQLPGAVLSEGSLEWRFEMWSSRLNVARSIDQVLFGGTFGVTPALGPRSTVMNPYNSAHSLVPDQWIMIGLFGLCALAMITVTAIWLVEDRLGVVPIFLWGLIPFGFTYNWPPWCWLLLGAGVAASAEHRRRQRGAG